MPELKTRKTTVHTLTLTDDELTALRNAASAAIEHIPGAVHIEAWRSFERLGLPALRGTEGHFGTTPPNHLLGRG